MPDDTQQAIPTGPSLAAGGNPQEHHMHLLGRCYRQLEAGRKTIEVRAATPDKRAVAAGDTIVFHDRDTGRELDVIVQRTTLYPSFDDLLSSEDPARIAPDRPPRDQLTALGNGVVPTSGPGAWAARHTLPMRPPLHTPVSALSLGHVG